ncbi:PREDICTED: microtubule-associated protein futsch-like [Ceratosolen solmsi marchali]|uniref:Microtubule-associated protein futsch-like n=1 Tax=Ceratosolen solmsi marchali TaxID=326594 RepID=A0AAJ7DXE4_9HYME|nr:PREDICTED: microtubule-associated protein futsch-like [Ceratosolen solmsi marchali]
MNTRNIKENVQIISDNIAESKQTITDNVEENEKIVSHTIDTIKQTVTDKVHGNKKLISNEMDDIKKMTSNKVDESVKIISNKIVLDKKEELSRKIDEVKSEMSETSLEKKDDFTLKLEKEDTTMINIVDSAIDIPNETIRKCQDIENNTGNRNLENDLLKSKSACLPNERKEEDDEVVEEENGKKSEEDNNKVDLSKMNNETKESCNIMDNGKISNEPLSIVDKNIINAISKEGIDNGNMNASCMVEQEEPCKEKSINALTETKETIDNKIHEEIPNKEDYISSKKSNEGNEISSLSSREMADLQGTKEFERQQKHQTGNTEFISTIVSDGARETVMEASQMKQGQDHVNVTEKKSTNSTIKYTSAPSFEKTSSSAKSNGKTRQKWNPERDKDPLLQVTAQQSKESFVIGFPPKTETVFVDKAKISANKAALDEAKMQKSHAKDSNATSRLLKSVENAEAKTSSSRQRTDTPKTRPVIVGVKRKDRTERRAVPSRGKTEEEAEYEKPQRRQSNWEARGKADAEQRKAVIRSRHPKLHVGHRAWQPKNEARVPEERCTSDVVAGTASPSGDSKDEGLPRRTDNGREPEIAKARSRYMAWYQQKRFEMERKRRERKEVEEDQMRPRWLRPGPGTKPRKAKSAEDADQRELLIKQSMGCQSRERAKSSSDVVQPTCFSRVRVRPLVNVESEQLKAIVRQGRKLRKAEGVKEAEPEVLIFAPEKPPRMDLPSTIIQHEPRHHLTQHSEYKFEKEVPAVPFYLHSPHVSQPTQEFFQDNSSESRRLEEDLDSGIAVSMQSGTEAAPTQLRSDSSTPPT